MRRLSVPAALSTRYRCRKPVLSLAQMNRTGGGVPKSLSSAWISEARLGGGGGRDFFFEVKKWTASVTCFQKEKERNDIQHCKEIKIKGVILSTTLQRFPAAAHLGRSDGIRAVETPPGS